LECLVGMREEKLGTENPDVDDEQQRLAELLKDAGRVWNKKTRSPVTLFENACLNHMLSKDTCDVMHVIT
jgi:hypothetical protein